MNCGTHELMDSVSENNDNKDRSHENGKTSGVNKRLCYKRRQRRVRMSKEEGCNIKQQINDLTGSSNKMTYIMDDASRMKRKMRNG